MSQNPAVGVPPSMTTRTRTTLPPNLTRHYYEARRRFLKSATGEEATPWFQLTPMDRAVVEGELAIYRDAIRAAEKEQDLLANLEASKSPVADEPAAKKTHEPVTAETDPAKACPCLGCSAVAAVLALTKQMGKRSEPSTEQPEKNRFPFGVFEVNSVPLHTRPWGVPPSEKDETCFQDTAGRNASAVLVTADFDLGVLDGTAPCGPLLSFDSPPIQADLGSLFGRPSFDDLRAEFWTKKPSTADKA